MKANALPASPPVTTPPAEPVSAAPGPETGSDFVGMLMQMLGGSAPAALSTSGGAKNLDLRSDAETEDPAALAAMLAMPVPMPLPWAALPSATSGEGTDPLELLGLAPGGGKGDASALLAIKADLANTLDEMSADATVEGNDSIGSLSPLTDLAAAKSAHTETPASRQLHAPVGSPQWADELATKLTWMVDKGQQTASLKLSPDNLGPLEVRISVTDDKTSVWFGAAHADTRAAIEHALPRLREMLSSQGLSLGDTGVFHEPPRDQSTPAPRSFSSNNSDGGSQEGEIMISTRPRSLLDAYA